MTTAGLDVHLVAPHVPVLHASAQYLETIFRAVTLVGPTHALGDDAAGDSSFTFT